MAVQHAHVLINEEWMTEFLLWIEEQTDEQDEMEKKLNKLDRAGGMSKDDIINLMNDSRLVERYTNHLNKIIFKYHNPFVKKKYQEYPEATGQAQSLDFFERMKLD